MNNRRRRRLVEELNAVIKELAEIRDVAYYRGLPDTATRIHQVALRTASVRDEMNPQ